MGGKILAETYIEILPEVYITNYYPHTILSSLGEVNLTFEGAENNLTGACIFFDMVTWKSAYDGMKCEMFGGELVALVNSEGE